MPEAVLAAGGDRHGDRQRAAGGSVGVVQGLEGLAEARVAANLPGGDLQDPAASRRSPRWAYSFDSDRARSALVGSSFQASRPADGAGDVAGAAVELRGDGLDAGALGVSTASAAA